MSTLVTYNGLQVLSPEPTATGGKAINDNFKMLSTDLATTNPTASQDNTQGFGVGSRWINTTSGAEWVCTNNATGAAVWQDLTTTITFANPSASVGLSTVNGSATTAMRSDAAPPLSQTITPTWSGLHSFSQNLTAGSGTNYALKITPTYNQTSAAGGTDLLVNRTQTAVGTGNQRFIDCQIAGTSKFYVDNNGNVIGNTFQPAVASVSYSATVTLDPTAGSVFKIGTLTGNITVSINSGLYDEQMIRVEFVQDSTGGRTLTWGGSNVAFGTTIPNTTLTTTANKTDYVALQWNASASKWRVVGFVQGY